MSTTIAVICSSEAEHEIMTNLSLSRWREFIRFARPNEEMAEVALITRDVWGTSTDNSMQVHTKAFFDALEINESLRWVHTYASGLDRPVYQRLLERGIRITNTAGANADAVAQTALAGFLFFARHLHIAWHNQQHRTWYPIRHTQVRALNSLRCLVVGWGEIGTRIGRYLTALGVEYSVLRHQAEPVPTALRTSVYEAFDEWVQEIDWVFFACPLSPATQHLFSAQTLTYLSSKHPLNIVNVARGGIIDTQALLEAKSRGLIQHAYLDVFEEEPLPYEHPLWDRDGILVSPHMAGASDGNRQRVLVKFAENLESYMKSRPC